MPATSTVPDSGELLDGDFCYELVRPGCYNVYSNNAELDLGKLFPQGFHGEVNLGMEGVHWAIGVKREARNPAHLCAQILPAHRGTSMQILTNAARVLREAFWPTDLPDHTPVRATNVADHRRVPLNLGEVQVGMKVCTRGSIQVHGIVAEIGHDDDGRDAVCLSRSPYIAHFEDPQGRRWYYADLMGLVPRHAGTNRAHWDPRSYTLPD